MLEAKKTTEKSSSASSKDKIETQNGGIHQQSQAFRDVSICGKLTVLGLNCGRNLKTIAFPESAKSLSPQHSFDLQAFHFHADNELLREARIVRVGLIQNSIALQTAAPFSDQKRAIYEKLKPIFDAAGASGVNGLQEAWMMLFAFFTREKR